MSRTHQRLWAWFTSENLGGDPRSDRWIELRRAADADAAWSRRLAEFAGHRRTCPAARASPSVLGPPRHCVCGYDELLAEWLAQIDKVEGDDGDSNRGGS